MNALTLLKQDHGNVEHLFTNFAGSQPLSAEGLKSVGKSMVLLGTVKKDPGVPWAKLINQDFLPAGAIKINPATISGP